MRGMHFFGAFLRGAHFFICKWGENMRKVVLKKTIDVTEVNLMPGEPAVCLGNGGQEVECCCDECDYFLLCFPEFDSKSNVPPPTTAPHK